jgi:hypothetical protein
MEFKEQIMVKTIATGDETTTTIAGTTTIAQIVVEITIGGAEFRGLTNTAEFEKARQGPWRIANWHFPDRASLFSSLQLRLILTARRRSLSVNDAAS